MHELAMCCTILPLLSIYVCDHYCKIECSIVKVDNFNNKLKDFKKRLEVREKKSNV